MTYTISFEFKSNIISLLSIIASKSLYLKPNQLQISDYKFHNEFGLSWEEAISSNIVYNADDAMNLLNVTPKELNSMWWRSPRLDLNGGVYIGKIKTLAVGTIYVINGFYPEMRAQYTDNQEASIYYFNVGFDSNTLSWLDFRRNIVGCDDPKSAGTYTIRGQIYENWHDYDLTNRPDIINNGIHVSASPFEAFMERVNWLKISPKDDVYGEKLLKSGLTLEHFREFHLNPSVYDDESNKLSKKKGVSFLLEKIQDMDWKECINMLLNYSMSSNSETDTNMSDSRTNSDSSIGDHQPDPTSHRSVTSAMTSIAVTSTTNSNNETSSTVSVDLRVLIEHSFKMIPTPRKRSLNVRRSIESSTFNASKDPEVIRRNNEYFAKVNKL